MIQKFSILYILLTAINAEAQSFSNQGEGKVVVQRFMSNKHIKNHNINEPLDTYTLYIKDSMVLRKENSKRAILHERIDSLNITTSPLHDQFGNASENISHSLSVRALEPSYLVNLKSLKGYAFGYRKEKIFYYEDILKNFKMDNLYRLLFDLREYNKLVSNDIILLNNYKIIARENCQEAILYFSDNMDHEKNIIEIRLWITKTKWPVKSPLNVIFLDEAPFSVLSVTIIANQKDKKQDIYLSYVVKNIKEVNIPNETFEILKDAEHLTKEEWENNLITFER